MPLIPFLILTLGTALLVWLKNRPPARNRWHRENPWRG